MISCSDYDHVEIACLFHYPVKLTLKDGILIDGIALDTTRDDNNAECIALKTQKGAVLVVLDDIAILDVTVDNPHFSRVSFD